jgi:hypothetical protein
MEQFIQKDVPAGIVRSVKEVFENETARKLVNTQQYQNGNVSKRVRTVVFNLE